MWFRNQLCHCTLELSSVLTCPRKSASYLLCLTPESILKKTILPSRRTFLSFVSAFACPILHRKAWASSPTPTHHFIQTTTFNSWPIANPAQWCLDHKHDPILERASDGLCKLTKEDSDRITRLVVRRCGLNLIHVQPSQVLIHHWSQQLADLRPFFQAHRLTSPDVQVTLLERKKESSTHKTGDDFLYGQPIAHDFPIELFVTNWNNRFQEESDDHLAAPKTNSGFAWDGLETGQIPWVALKSAWQRSQPSSCLNCSAETILVNFGFRQVGLFNRSPNFVSVCPNCRRSFVDESITDVAGWMAENLKTDFYPMGEVVWGKRVALTFEV